MQLLYHTYKTILKAQRIAKYATLLLICLLLLPAGSLPQTNQSDESYNSTLTLASISYALEIAANEPEMAYHTIRGAIVDAEMAQDRPTSLEGYIALAKYSLINKNLDEALLAANQAYILSVELNLLVCVHRSLRLLSEVHLQKDLKDETLEYLYKGILLSRQLNDTSATSWYLLHIPSIELEMGSIVKAMQFSLQGVSLFEQNADSLSLGKLLLTLGSIHSEIGNYPSAQANIGRAIGIFTFFTDTAMVGRAYLSNAELLLAQNQIPEAESSIQRSILFLTNHDPRYYYRAISLQAEILIASRQYPKAYDLLNEAIANQQTDFSGLALSLIRLGNLHLKNNKPSAAQAAFQQSIGHSSQVGLINLIRHAYKGLAKCQGLSGNHTDAYRSLLRYTSLTDSLYNLQKVSEATKLEEDHDQRKHQQEIKRREVELEKRKVLIAQQRQKQLLLYIVIILFFGIIVLAYREFRLKKKANQQLALQRDQLEEQKQIAELRTRDFTDSLNYAKRIQQAILTASLRLKEFFPDSFLFLIPRDIVSGDFYWVTKKNDRIMFAIADCTGHGVPGAFMSIIGTYGLNQLINEHNITTPGEILNRIDSLFENSLEQSEGAEIFDGMDIGLCSYNPSNNELSYAGANIPLYILREQGLPQPASQIAYKTQTHLLYQVSPVKQSIGSRFDRLPFVTHSITLMKGDTLYLFSDGFADQFGGDKGRKFRANELRKLIGSMANLPLEHQKEVLLEAFYQWKGKSMQVDDVSFLAVRI